MKMFSIDPGVCMTSAGGVEVGNVSISGIKI